MSPRILVLPGTMEARSPNHRLAFEAARQLGLTDALVTLVGLADYPLPVIDTDAETPNPPSDAVRLAERIAAQDALLLVSPEANGSLPPLLKNAVDWVARVAWAKGRPAAPFRGLLVALACASAPTSPAAGGFRVLDAWRDVFRSLGAEVLGTEARIDGGEAAFDERGRLSGPEGEGFEAFLDGLLLRARTLGRRPV